MMSVENSKQIAIKSDLNKKSKSVFKNIFKRLNASSPSPSSSSSSSSQTLILRTSAGPSGGEMQQNQTPSTSNVLEQSCPHISAIPSNESSLPAAQLVQNNMNQAKQNVTMVEHQQNINISNSAGIHIGDKFFHGFGPRKNNCGIDSEDNITKTPSIVELMNSQELVESDDPIIRISARFIGENWRMVFRDLGIPSPEIDQIKEQYFHINIEEVNYQLLLRWQRNRDEPSVGRLTTVLWKNKNRKCVYELKEYFKKLRIFDRLGNGNRTKVY